MIAALIVGVVLGHIAGRVGASVGFAWCDAAGVDPFNMRKAWWRLLLPVSALGTLAFVAALAILAVTK